MGELLNCGEFTLILQNVCHREESYQDTHTLLKLSDTQNMPFAYSEFQMIALCLLKHQDSGNGFVCTDLFQPVPRSRTFG